MTIWPRKHKRKTPSHAFTRSKQIYRFGRSLKFCGTVHTVCDWIFFVLLCRGQTPEESELKFLENAKKLALYGVELHPAKVHFVPIYTFVQCTPIWPSYVPRDITSDLYIPPKYILFVICTSRQHKFFYICPFCQGSFCLSFVHPANGQFPNCQFLSFITEHGQFWFSRLWLCLSGDNQT